MDAAPADSLTPAAARDREQPSTETVIAQSRQRCAREHRLCPQTRAAPVVRTPPELRALREPLEPTLALVHDELDALHALVRTNGYSVLLAAADGTIVDQRCRAEDRRALAAQGTCPGGLWSEAAAGTNGIGTCLLAQRALTVHRAQHYRQGHAHMSCSSAPILDGDGRLAAVLTLASHAGAASDSTHGLALSLAVHWARRIEAGRFRERHRRAWLLALQPQGREDEPAGLLALEADGRVIAADPQAQAWRGAGAAAAQPGGSIHAAFAGLPAELPCGVELRLRLQAQRDGREWVGALRPPLAPRPTPMPAALRPAAPAPAPAPASTAAAVGGGLAPRAQRAVLAYIAAHLDAEIRVDALAATAGLSPKHFSRVFRHSLGCTPHRYLMRQRVQRAAELLVATAQTPAAIAQATGFADQSHMTRCFLRELGTSPCRYRRAAQADERAH